MPTNLAAPLGLDKDLVYKFFLYFSRFEYALKQAGFATGGKKWAKPAWDRFAISLRGKFDSVTADEFKEAIRYLDSKPPKKQVLECGHLGWADNKDEGSPAEEK